MNRISTFLFALVFSFFLNVSYSLADEIKGELNNNFSKEYKTNNYKNKNNDKIDISKSSNEDIFGDEQAFPFIAGLGKNAAH